MFIKLSLVVLFFCALAQHTFVEASDDESVKHSITGNILRTGAKVERFKGSVVDEIVGRPTVIGKTKEKIANVMDKLANKADNVIAKTKNAVKEIFGRWF